VVILTLGGLMPLGTSSAGAVQGTPENPNPNDTHCLAEFDLTLSPGISMTPASGTATSHGETGTNTCDGPINGKQVTGVGSRGEDGRYGIDGPNNCTDLDGVSEWVFSFTMPTTDGPQKVMGTFVATYGPLQSGGLYGGTFTGDRMYGKFTATPIEGDCVTTPITKVRLHCDEWVVNET
ncbi:MAG: hypothetical protein ACRDYF_08400, partial [Acidimicrobiia bacterium]